MAIIESDLLNRLSPPPEQTGMRATVAGLIVPLLSERNELVEAREEAKANVERLTEEIAYADRVLKAAGYEEPKPQRKSKGLPQSLSREVATTVRFVAEATEPVTSKEVAEALDIKVSAAGRRLGIGHGLGLLRQTGTRENDTGRDSNLYAAYPDTIERMEAMNGRP